MVEDSKIAKNNIANWDPKKLGGKTNVYLGKAIWTNEIVMDNDNNALWKMVIDLKTSRQVILQKGGKCLAWCIWNA